MITSVSIAVGIILGLINTSFGQDADCDYTQSLAVGQTYYVYNKEYPQNYTAGVTCRWQATAPDGFNCLLNCEVNLPDSVNCVKDRLLVSRSGDPQLSGADTYCGKGSFTLQSTGQKLSIGLLSAYDSKGGRFLCELSAVAATPNPDDCTCGYKKTNRIVGGVETGVNEFPCMAGLVDLRISTIKCGAVIIQQHYVLTVAHCLVGHTPDTLAVVVGEHDVNSGDSPATQVLRILKMVSHPAFNSQTFDNDIAVIQTVKDMTFSDRVGPVCLPFKYRGVSFAGEKVDVLGWGTIYPGGPDSDYLQKVKLDVITNQRCKSQVATLTDRQLCTNTTGKDACQDDSGGPALWTNPQNGLLFGIAQISTGQFCASSSPGINTRNTEFLDWIVANTPDANYCIK